MSASDGYIVGTSKIVDNGPDSSRWNLVIIGDGYRDSELTQYHTDVENFLTKLRTTPPFDELFCGINVHRIDVVSTDSGADDPTDCAGGTGAAPRTYFDATFCSVGPGGVRLDRLLTVDTGLALSVASAQVPLRHQVLCFVNSSKYGGSGGIIATCSTNAQASDIAIHEMGHSAFGLADEYGGNGIGTPSGEPSQPNVTRDTNRATNKWRDLIAVTTPMPSACDSGCQSSTCVPPGTPPPAGAVGTYEGAIYSDCNTYRPLPNCYMRDYAPFCPVCAGVIRQTLQPFLPAAGGGGHGAKEGECPMKEGTEYRFQYAAKLLCTANIPGTSQTTPSVLPGVYQTAVNIHNPHEESVRWRRKITQPLLGISQFIEAELKPDEAVRVDCDQLVSDFGPFLHGAEGFVVIESSQSLDVTAVYTAGKRGGEVESIAVEQIKERKLKKAESHE